MIRVQNVRKDFKLYRTPSDRLKELFFRRRYHRVLTALDDVSFEVGDGETLGVVGVNGAGKSTLLKILVGVLMPDAGIVDVDGRITGLLELGTGFNHDFSGLENIYMNGTFLGMTREEIEARRQNIISFSELGDFIGEPLKTYSSGMIMRLAFSVAIHAEPRAFVVDEALSVGDAYFQQKCMRRIREFKEQGGSIVFVSHDLNAVKVLCDRAILLDSGRIEAQGEPEEVMRAYNLRLAYRTHGEELGTRHGECVSYGDFKAEIIRVEVLDGSGSPAEALASGAPCSIAIHIAVAEDLDDLTVGILIRDRFGQDLFGTNTCHLGKTLSARRGEVLKVVFRLDELNLGLGKYTLTTALHREDTHDQGCYHWIDSVRSFEVAGILGSRFDGLVRLTPSLSVERA